MDPDNEFRYVAEPIYCHACTTAGKVSAEFSGEDSVGLNVSTRLKD